jgi:hypothetical protein
LVAGVGVLPIEVLLGQEVFKEGQGIEKNPFGDIEQVAPVKVHWHSIGFVNADDLHQVLGCVRQH